MNNAVTQKRIHSIDLLRGLVMMLMALDHVRDFFHNTAMQQSPLDLQTTTPLLYFTRWITHYCAPTFVFLSGASAYLSGLKKTKAELSGFLFKRGLWLIVMEVTIVNFGWSFNPLFNTTVFQVIWAIGISMVILAGLVRLPFAAVLGFGLIILLGHNLLDYYEASHKNELGFGLSLLHNSNYFNDFFAPTHSLLVIYPFLPWTGIMALGFCFGRLFQFDVATRRKYFMYIVAVALVLFTSLRFANSYGDSQHWSQQKSTLYTFLSFMDVSKYPPSLLFTLATVGSALFVLVWFENLKPLNPLTKMMNVYGRVPFFYYVLHIYIIHVLTVILFFASGYGAADIVTPHSPFLFRPQNFGFDLWAVYLIWMVVLLMLYLPCRWYDNYKTANKKWWLSYL